MKYLVILEPIDTGYSAYSPDMDGCAAAGATKSETMELMREALVMHVEALLEDGLPVPQPSSEAELIEVAA